MDRQTMASNSNEPLYIIAAHARGLDFFFECEILTCLRSKDIPLIEVETDCEGGELLKICYGLSDSQTEPCNTFLPAFGLPYEEIERKTEALNNPDSNLGHIRRCLERGLNMMRAGTLSAEEIAALRRESLGGFYYWQRSERIARTKKSSHESQIGSEDECGLAMSVEHI